MGDVVIWIVSYWNDAWNNPLGARALYESVRRYTSNVGIEQRAVWNLLSRVSVPLLGIGPHCRNFPGLSPSLEHFSAFLEDRANRSDPFASEYSSRCKVQVEQWMQGTAESFVDDLVVCDY